MVKTAIDAVFLALKKVGVGQYEDSDSKPAVGVSTQAQLLAKAGQWRSQMQGVQGFFLGGGGKFWWFLVISKGTFQALKQLIFN